MKTTIKQKKFIKAYLSNGGNGTKAALVAYDTKNPNVAKVIASENLTKPNIRLSVMVALEAVGLNDIRIAEMLREATEAGISQKATNSDSLRGIELMLKLKDAFPDKKTAHMNINIKKDYENKDADALRQELEENLKLSQELLKDLKS